MRSWMTVSYLEALMERKAPSATSFVTSLTLIFANGAFRDQRLLHNGDLARTPDVGAWLAMESWEKSTVYSLGFGTNLSVVPELKLG